VEALTNGLGRDIVERAAVQHADLSSLMQPRQGIDKFPQERAALRRRSIARKPTWS
jgi:hypothetical protein